MIEINNNNNTNNNNNVTCVLQAGPRKLPPQSPTKAPAPSSPQHKPSTMDNIFHQYLTLFTEHFLVLYQLINEALMSLYSSLILLSLQFKPFLSILLHLLGVVDGQLSLVRQCLLEHLIVFFLFSMSSRCDGGHTVATTEAACIC